MALRALDLDTGRVAWEIPQIGNSNNYAGALSTAGGLVFYGQASGEFAAVDAKTGAHLWHFETQETWKASPMTYTVNGRQYVAITSGANLLAFALPWRPPAASRRCHRKESMKVRIAAVIAVLLAASPIALERPDVTFRIFQFPPDQIPRVDGKVDDWSIVPDSYAVGMGGVRGVRQLLGLRRVWASQRHF
jgi:hypothetical protein